MKVLAAAVVSLAILAAGACAPSKAETCWAKRQALTAENQLTWNVYETRLTNYAQWGKHPGVGRGAPDEPEFKSLPECE